MKKIPDAELELMLIIWEADGPISRLDIESKLKDKDVVASTLLSLLSRLEAREFISRTKEGKLNYYTPLVKKEDYLKETSRNILSKMFGGSIANFAAALYSDEKLSEDDIAELQSFIDSKRSEE